MHYQPRLTSPLNASAQLKNSRVSERSTEGDHSFKVNRSFDFESSFIDSLANQHTVVSVITGPSSQLSPSLGRSQPGAPEEIKRFFLTKVLINRMLKVRAALKRIQNLPIKIFKKSSSFGIAKEIVLRLKPNIETSILRTLIFAEEQRVGKESKLSCSSCQDVFVLPTRGRKDEVRSRRALIDLAGLVKSHTKRAVKAFEAHSQQQQAVARYFRRILANEWQMIETAFSKFKRLPPVGTSSKVKTQLANSQLKLACRIIDGKHRNLLQASFAAIRVDVEGLRLKQESVAKQIIAFSRIRKEQCLK